MKDEKSTFDEGQYHQRSHRSQLDRKRFPMTDPVVETACECIQDIIEHLSMKDNPPVNWNHSVRSIKFDSALEEKSNVPNVPSSTDNNINNLDSVNAATEYSASFTADMIGHSSLISLSKWTLQEMNERYSLGLVKEERSENTEPIPVSIQKNDEALQFSSKRSWRGILRRTHDTIKSKSSRKSCADREGKRMHQFGSEYAKYLYEQTKFVPNKAQPRNFRRRRNSLVGNSRRRKETESGTIQNIEEADDSFRTGALVDICVTVGSAPPPTGYFRVSQSASGQPFFVGNGAHDSRKMYLNIKKEPSWDKAAQRPCVTALCLIFPDRNESVPPGFSVVKHADSATPADFGMGDGSKSSTRDRIILCYRLSREGNPLTGIVPLVPHFGEGVPSGFTVIERSPRNHTAHFSSIIPAAASAPDRGIMCDTKVSIFLAYRQRLENLESLRPLPLLLSVDKDSSKMDGETPILSSYFCSGGSVVSSSIGRFHILDRSTHNLLGPTSVKNRLKLIEASRRKALETGRDDGFPCDSYSRSDDLSSVGGGLMPKRNGREGWTENSSADYSAAYMDGDSVTTPNALITLTNTNERFSGCHVIIPTIGTAIDVASAMDAMNFIPCPDVATGSSEERLEALNRLSIRTALLLPILSACYTRHGGGALLEVESLIRLLTQTAFFEDDVEVADESDGKSCSRLTLLDLSVQAVCDVATSAAEETTFSSCVEFVELAVQFSQGQLSTRTVGIVVRFYLLVFSFGASDAGYSSSKWPLPSWQISSTNHGHGSSNEEDVPLLLDIRKGERGRSIFPGGAPQAAALAFKDLIYLSIVRLGKVSLAELFVMDGPTNDDLDIFEKATQAHDPYAPFLDTILSGLIDEAVSNVDRANSTQLALHQVRRSGGSEMFWHDMVTICGQSLFRKHTRSDSCGKDVFILIFAIFANITKISSGKLRLRSRAKDVMPRDLACKLLSLEILLHFLECWSDEQEAVVGASREMGSAAASPTIETLAYSIRRMVAPCLLWNTQACFENHLVFRRVFRIITEIWISPMHRKRCKAELGVLIEHFAVRLLEGGPQLINVEKKKNDVLFLQQIELVKELKYWFSQDPKDAIEFFLNFDTDLSLKLVGSDQHLPGKKWKLFQRICSGLSCIAERSTEIIGQHIQRNRSLVEKATCDKVAMSNETLDEPLCASETQNKTRESATILRGLSLETLSQIVKSIAFSAAVPRGSSFLDLLISWDLQIDSPFTFQRINSVSSVQPDSSLAEETDPDIANLPSLKIDKRKCNNVYIETSEDTDESLDVVLHIAKGKNIKKAIEYLIACNTITSSPRDIAYFLQSNRDVLDPADLGTYISEGGVGDAEIEYRKSIRYLFVRTFSFVGLNLDQALRQFLTASGLLLPGEAQRIDRLIETFSKCFYEDNAGDSRCCPFESEEPVYVLCFSIIMLNTDLHKVSHRSRRGAKKMTKAEFIANTRDADGSLKVSAEYLASIYDSVKTCPITLEKMHSQKQGEVTSVNEWLAHARNADSHLRSFAVHDFSFATVEQYGLDFEFSESNALHDLTSKCVSETWHQWYGVISTSLETALLDSKGLLPSLQILLYAIATTICLDMPVARAAFLGQLGKFVVFNERRNTDCPILIDHGYRKKAWFVEIEDLSVGSDESKYAALQQVYSCVRSLQQSLSDDRSEMTDTVEEIKSGAFLVDDPARTFLRSGDLHKKSSRTGRSSQYRFYLFSDVILYCSAESKGRYRIHEEFPLHQLKVIDWFPPSNRQRDVLFEVHHPRKSFQVLCSDGNEKKIWVTDIREAVRLEVERKSKIEAARLSFFTPMRDHNGSAASF